MKPKQRPRQELPHNKKLALLRAQCSKRIPWKNLDEEVWCLHCDSKTSGHAIMPLISEIPGLEYELVCGNEGCNGSPLDWSSEKWWES